MQRAEVEKLNREILDQENSLRVLERDAQDSTRVDNLIRSKLDQIERLQREVDDLRNQKLRMPAVIAAARRKLERLRTKRLTLQASSEIEKLRTMIAKAKSQGINVEKLFSENSQNHC